MTRPTLRPGLPDLPLRMRSLPLDERGYPVPFFTAWIDGKPDFRGADVAKLIRCVRYRLCWICGQPLGVTFAYVIGPMCAVNHVSSEPPSHRDCAEFAVRACPFILLPRSKRREKPEQAEAPPGIFIERNPGVSLVWVSRTLKPERVAGGVLFDVGEPLQVHWYACGRAATRAECLESLRAGLPSLEAHLNPNDPREREQFNTQVARAQALIP